MHLVLTDCVDSARLLLKSYLFPDVHVIYLDIQEHLIRVKEAPSLAHVIKSKLYTVNINNDKVELIILCLLKIIAGGGGHF